MQAPKGKRVRRQANRQNKLFWEEKLWKDNVQWVAGLDEAGRGAWAGPVVAAAVIFKPHTFLPDIDDSKKINPEKREFLFDLICREATAYGIGCVPSSVIDEENILQATVLAMKEAVFSLKTKPNFLLVDGNRGLGLNIPQKTIVRGDSLSLSIGAASILAKVTRDRLMRKLGEEHDQFKFSVHKGYGTRTHREELGKYGLLPCHRLSFEPMRSMVK